MEGKLVDGPVKSGVGRDGAVRTEKIANGSGKRSWRRCVVLSALVILAGGAGLICCATRLVDTTPPKPVFKEVVPDKPLLDESEQRVTFVLEDDKRGIPTFFIFDGEDQKTTALSVNTLRGTPNERGVEIRLEAVRFRRDESDPDKLWVRAVGIANESEGKTPVSLSELESGEAMDLHFHDEIKESAFGILVVHVIYEIHMTIQYDPKVQQLTLSNASGSLQWTTPLSDAFDEGKLEGTITGRKGEYAEKPLLNY